MGRRLFCRGLTVIKNKLFQIKNFILFCINIFFMKGYKIHEKILNRKIYRLNTKRERLHSQIKKAADTININYTYGDANSNTEIMDKCVNIMNRCRIQKKLLDETIKIEYNKLESVRKKLNILIRKNQILRP